MTLLSLQGDAALFFFIKVTFTHKYEWDRTDVECQTFFFHLERANLTNSCRKYYSFFFFTPYSCKHYLLYKWTELKVLLTFWHSSMNNSKQIPEKSSKFHTSWFMMETTCLHQSGSTIQSFAAEWEERYRNHWAALSRLMDQAYCSYIRFFSINYFSKSL